MLVHHLSLLASFKFIEGRVIEFFPEDGSHYSLIPRYVRNIDVVEGGLLQMGTIDSSLTLGIKIRRIFFSNNQVSCPTGAYTTALINVASLKSGKYAALFTDLSRVLSDEAIVILYGNSGAEKVSIWRKIVGIFKAKGIYNDKRYFNIKNLLVLTGFSVAATFNTQGVVANRADGLPMVLVKKKILNSDNKEKAERRKAE